MNLRLSHAVAYTASLVAFASVLFLGAVLYNFFSNQLKQSIEERNELVARASGGEVAAALRLPSEVLRQVADQIDVRDPVIYSEAQMDLQVQRNGFFEAILLLDREGNSVAVGTQPSLSRYKNELRDLSMAFQDFYTQVLGGNTTYWSRIISSPITGQPSLTVSFDSGQEVLVGYLNLEWLEQIALRLELGGTVDIRFVDSDGVLFRAPDTERALQRLNVSNIPLIAQALDGQEGTDSVTYFGQSLLATVVNVPSTRWVLMVSQSEAEAFAPLEELLRITVMAALLALVVGGLIALWLSRRGTNSIVRLSQEVRRIADGDYLYKPASEGFIEARALSRDVQSMAASIAQRERELTDARDQLYQTNEQLEERVRARTEELLDSQAALRQSEQIKSLLESSPVAVGIYRRGNGQVLFANRRNAELFGMTVPEVYKHQVSDNWVHESQRQRLLARFDTGKDIADQEVQFKRRDGGHFWGLLTWYHLEMEGHKCILYWIYDITEMKRVEAELERARQDAEMAARAKSDFLANMSHEIRTPMSAVIGLSHLLENTQLDGRQKDYLTKMQNASDHLLSVINDILDYSKLESGLMKMESIPFRIDEVLDKACDIVRLQSEGKGLELVIAHDWGMPQDVVGDPLRLGQILINLLTNAVKFTERGQVIVSVALMGRESGRSEYRFKVSDSGMGMTQQQIGQVFSSFSQADTSTTRRFGGTGLGLAICSQLVERMGGSISVTSELGKGSEFTFSVQLASQEANTEGTDADAELLEGEPRVLLMDDSPVSSALFKSIISQFGAEVVSLKEPGKISPEIKRANSGANPYDLLLVDCRQLDNEGVGCLRELLGDMEETPIPVVLMSGSRVQPEILEDPSFIRIRQVLLKPVSPSTLFNALRETLRGTWSSRDKQAMPLAGFSQTLDGLAGARALVVEDTHVNQQVVRELLEINGLVVRVCGDGREALQALQEEPFDIVLMDIQMPVMDGYEATREIRKNPAWRTLPVVAMTAHTLAGDRERCLEAGMNDHIGKPLDPDRLYQTLKRWIEPQLQLGKVTRPPKARQVEGEVELPDYLPGLDLDQALNRVGGNRALLLKLLLEFYRSYQRTGAELLERVDAGKQDEAARLVHTIKGAAGNLGGGRVVSCSEDLLRRWKNEGSSLEDTREEVTALVNAINEILRGLARIKEPAPETLPQGELRVDETLSLMRTLERQLQQSNSRARDTLSDIRRALGGHFAERFTLLQDQVDNYEYELAAKTLADMIPALEDRVSRVAR
ncbi:response regulator [Aestuariirhabdus litorea]|uniref:histidine kinase n=1 Tax=Aestuariirhabdus litorea TaxID=2528527 RepID=A0A3P3VND0_9GAMM|nr:response regulator [Aestuariirhabdus litorea]RRJ84261.1 response regulator [Aestuariirhabdus litorea]RWW97483.1 response regulator [Endozoicomonadaceae bacterium GTF-13]